MKTIPDFRVSAGSCVFLLSAFFSATPRSLPASPAHSGHLTNPHPELGRAHSPAEIEPRALFAATEGNGTQVALADGGVILRSADGQAWSPTLQAKVPLYAITYGSGLFV